MFKSLKLKTISILVAVLLLTVGFFLTISSSLILKEVNMVQTAWKYFNVDRSEKAKLEGALHSAIGYGGMIHEFKNLVLHKNSELAEHIHSLLGAAESIIKQYEILETNSAEGVALEDIKLVIANYKNALFLTQKMIKSGKTAKEIDAMVKVDDKPALRGLVTLRHEVRGDTTVKNKPNKTRLAADIRASLGYGAMIHYF